MTKQCHFCVSVKSSLMQFMDTIWHEVRNVFVYNHFTCNSFTIDGVYEYIFVIIFMYFWYVLICHFPKTSIVFLDIVTVKSIDIIIWHCIYLQRSLYLNISNRCYKDRLSSITFCNTNDFITLQISFVQ
jgi:hypothetical protein